MEETDERDFRPVGRLLREQLNRCGEHVPASSVIDMEKGRVYRKSPSGKYQDITVDSKKVLYTVERYLESIEATRSKCSEARKNRI